MLIEFTPQRSDDHLTLERQGDTLIVNDQPLDFSPLPEGAELPAEAVDCAFLIGSITRKDGVLRFRMILPHGPNATEAERMPQPLLVTKDGPISLFAQGETA
jgi:hypothetical protein